MPKLVKRLMMLLKQEKIRFLIVGSFNTAMDFILLNLLTLVLGIFYVYSNIISVLICMTASYFLNHYYVFRKKEKVTLWSFTTFFAVTGFSSLALQSGIIIGMHWLLNTPFSRSLFIDVDFTETQAIELNISKAIAIGIGMVWNYLFYKKVVFRKKADISDAEFIG